MAGQTVCPRCGARDSFMKGYLPETCVCRVCQSQLDWREIPGCGPDCAAMRSGSGDAPSSGAAAEAAATGAAATEGTTSGAAPASGSDAWNSFQNEAPPQGTRWTSAREGRRERE
jgi:hypothetical protein